ncbi:YebC/PmpR family DNA-binding transcriptional regulator [Candidatus Saccharibacteria bacterium]|nr:YebC/PmpR family DNA-binding transcriptional regulator [Candidatus Saccharibacteria bacterium]
MSGHSKWSTIKRQKAVTDAKRGAVFTRLGNMIAIAARGGADPDTNSALAMAIDKAKAANMPLSNIERAIQRVTDKGAAQLHEVMYEGYGPGGVAILVECATDNINRTYPEVKNAFNKKGGSIADKGSVAYQFDRKGVITVKATGEDALLAILDAGAEDANEHEGEIIVYTDPKELAKVRDSIKYAGLEVVDAELSYEPNTTVELSDEQQEKVMNLMEALEDLDDVVATHTNLA